MTILNQLQNYNWSQSNVENIKEIIKSKNSKNEDLLNKMLGSHNFIKKEISQNEKSITQTEYYSKFRELFDVKNDTLYYKPLNLKIYIYYDVIHSIHYSKRRRRTKRKHIGVEINNKAALEDVGQNADLYIANQRVKLGA